MATQLWTQVKAHVYYLQLIATPVRLNVGHQMDVTRSAESSAVMALLFLTALGGTAWRLRQQLGWTVLAVGWWVLFLLPTTLIPLIVLVNEHRIYLASLGVILPLAVCISRFGGGRRVGSVSMATLALALYTIVLALLTMQRVGDWDSEVTLWADATTKSPQILRPHLRLADALLRERGEAAFAAAEASYRRAIALRPHHPASRNNLGLLYRRMGRIASAEQQLRTLLQASPDHVSARLNLADLLLEDGRWQAADSQYDSALIYEDTRGQAQIRKGKIALHSGHAENFDAAIAAGADEEADAHVGSGVALRKIGYPDLALEAYKRATVRAPERSDLWCNFGNLYVDRDEFELAIAAYQRVVDNNDDEELTRRAAIRIRDLLVEPSYENTH